MIDLTILQHLFPKKDETATAVTGYIPIDYFERFEDCIRKVCREEGLKTVYRGPRRNAMKTFTARADAKAVVLYRK